MTFHQVEFFISCAALLNFSRAAKYHYTSISTMSRQIAALEKESGAALFKRNNHTVSLTHAGEFFFDGAMDIKDVLGDYRQNLNALGLLKSIKKNDAFRIACYPFDGMFGHLLNLIDYFPSNGLSKPCKIDIVRPGTVLETVLRGDAQMGVVLASILRKHHNVFDSQVFCRVPVCLRVGRAHPLRGEISVEPGDLLNFFTELSIHNDISDELRQYDLKPMGDGLDIPKIQCLAEATEEYLLSRIPGITASCALLDRPDCMLLIAESLDVPKFKRLQSVSIKGNRVMVDFAVFWKKDDADPNIRRFLNLLEAQNGFDRASRRKA
jgi:DNA-binding transcriptional LysR family regulator